jgi:acyl phosphate:glycerol-3-phosphate acyltransferase
VPVVAYLLTGLAGYLLGSLPTGYLWGRARGIDIRKLGSGNIGATNVFRNLGTAAGVMVLVVDAAKGWLAVFAGQHGFASLAGSAAGGSDAAEWFGIVGGFTAILGHNYTCWLQFKGGKGIATSAGALLALVPMSLLMGLGVFILVVGLSRYVSLASISAAATIPMATWLTRQSPRLIVITTAMAALAIYKHRSNIKRLLNGTENRLGSRAASVAARGEDTT